jgi:hypothetical protein
MIVAVAGQDRIEGFGELPGTRKRCPRRDHRAPRPSKAVALRDADATCPPGAGGGSTWRPPSPGPGGTGPTNGTGRQACPPSSRCCARTSRPTAPHQMAGCSAPPAVFTPAQHASPLACRPYDLRHAAVLAELRRAATEIAGRAGHSIAVLLKVYVHCIDGQDPGQRTGSMRARQRPGAAGLPGNGGSAAQFSRRRGVTPGHDNCYALVQT